MAEQSERPVSDFLENGDSGGSAGPYRVPFGGPVEICHPELVPCMSIGPNLPMTPADGGIGYCPGVTCSTGNSRRTRILPPR